MSSLAPQSRGRKTMIVNNTQVPRQTRAFWQEHIEQWKQSGLSKIAYSKEHNLKSVSFYNWSKKLEHTDSPLPTIADTLTRFVPVQIDQQRTIETPTVTKFSKRCWHKVTDRTYGLLSSFCAEWLVDARNRHWIGCSVPYSSVTAH